MRIRLAGTVVRYNTPVSQSLTRRYRTAWAAPGPKKVQLELTDQDTFTARTIFGIMRTVYARA
jgi:hypothetical protein